MAIRSLSGVVYLAHVHISSGNGTSPLFYGDLVNYNAPRTQVHSGPVRIRVTSWGDSGAAGRCMAMRFSIRNAAGVSFDQGIEIPRGQTGFYSVMTHLPAGTVFYVSARAVGGCGYSTPNGMVSDPIGHEFPWHGEIEYQP